MPTFKHPCPYCGKFIDKVVSACPFCGVVEPFSPKRCQNCRKIVEDPAWVVCPSCGLSLLPPPPAAAGTAGSAGAGQAGAGAPGTAPAPTGTLPYNLALRMSSWTRRLKNIVRTIIIQALRLQ